MNFPEAPASTVAANGRERVCAQCCAVYRAARSTSRYCTDRCRKRSYRGTEDTDGKTLDLLRRWLLRRSYGGKIGPVNRRDPRCPVYALTVPRGFALEEWNVWNPGASMTGTEFASALDRLGFRAFDYDPRKRS